MLTKNRFYGISLGRLLNSENIIIKLLVLRNFGEDGSLIFLFVN